MTAPVGLCYLDCDLRYVHINEQLAALNGISVEDHIGKTVSEVLPEVAEIVESQLRGLIATGEPYSNDAVYAQTPAHPEEKRHYLADSYADKSADGTVIGIKCCVRDVTDSVRAEERRLLFERSIHRTQKLENLGVLAGGLAHNFNNLLSVVLGNAELTLDELSAHAPMRENIERIRKACEKGAELTDQMLAYSGQGSLVVEPINVEILVREMTQLLEISISKNVSIRYEIDDDLPSFQGDVTQVRRAIINLISNASEAIGDASGTITLSVGVLDYDPANIEDGAEIQGTQFDEPLSKDLYVKIEVTDTGSGMEPQTVERLFDPFFTTKFAGRGLGMSAVLGIMRRHNGVINVESAVGEGSTFRLLFPTHSWSQDIVSVERTGADESQGWRGSGTILIADDEDEVLAVGKRMLERIGFRVLTAADGLAALEVFNKNADEIVCVLFDLTMPRMGGEDALREIRRKHSQVKAILCSGYSMENFAKRFSGLDSSAFIQKPYRLADLRKSLKAILS